MAARKGGGGGGGGGVVVVVVVVMVWGAPHPATTTTTPAPLPPLPPSTTAAVMTEAPPLPPQRRMRPKDCPLYVLGELSAIKKHGETWLNNGNACELCECVEGLKRCYYHYCNQGIEVVTNPPSGHPPLDDEDGGKEEEGEEEGEEGSGRPPPPPLQYSDRLKDYRKNEAGALRLPAGENDTRLPAFCDRYCSKHCPWGYKTDPQRQCRQCSCKSRCPSLAPCGLRCPQGYAKDSQGCPLCVCRPGGTTAGGHAGGTSLPTSPASSIPQCEKAVSGCLDGAHARAVGEQWWRGPCVACVCVSDGYTECNVTHCPPAPPCPPRPQGMTSGDAAPLHHHHHHHYQACCPACEESADQHEVNEVSVGRAEVTVQSAWERHPRPPSPPPQGSASDGAVKSAVQAKALSWWQVSLIMVPLAVVCVVGVVWALRCYRRAHHDKYDISTYTLTPAQVEKVRHG